jgi:hypothetical protein
MAGRKKTTGRINTEKVKKGRARAVQKKPVRKKIGTVSVSKIIGTEPVKKVRASPLAIGTEHVPKARPAKARTSRRRSARSR